ncbi:MAG: hypothetical protein HY322_03920 [Betaproteobacteria bacterium]|nr:hypothetical protein [Betaproteobacteria bacterium]
MANEAQPSSAFSCPRCFSGNLKRRQSAKSVGVWFGAFAVLAFLISGATHGGSSSAGGALLLVLFFMLFVVGIGAVMAPFSLAFGKNRCKDCGHKRR